MKSDYGAAGLLTVVSTIMSVLGGAKDARDKANANAELDEIRIQTEQLIKQQQILIYGGAGIVVTILLVLLLSGDKEDV
jgi:hypothetical protein